MIAVTACILAVLLSLNVTSAVRKEVTWVVNSIAPSHYHEELVGYQRVRSPAAETRNPPFDSVSAVAFATFSAYILREFVPLLVFGDDSNKKTLRFNNNNQLKERQDKLETDAGEAPSFLDQMLNSPDVWLDDDDWWSVPINVVGLWRLWRARNLSCARRILCDQVTQATPVNPVFTYALAGMAHLMGSQGSFQLIDRFYENDVPGYYEDRDSDVTCESMVPECDPEAVSEARRIGVLVRNTVQLIRRMAGYSSSSSASTVEDVITTTESNLV